MISSRLFGSLPDHREVTAYTLTNSHGLSVEVITLGGIVTCLHVPDRSGQLADVVAGFHSLDGYVAGHPCFGTITGRVAGRLSGGTFAIDGQHFQLAINDAPNHLHGGVVGLDKRLWSAEVLGSTLRLSYLSPDGEEGYPGNLNITVDYSLSDANEFSIRYIATTDQPTPLNLTNHSYFNLAGPDSDSICDHVLQIFSDAIVPTDDQMTLLGRREAVSPNGNDFRTPRRLGDAIPRLHRQHGDNYLLRTGHIPSPALAARLEDPASGRVMEIFTTERCLQLYCGTALDGTLVGKTGVPYVQHAAVCLECQGYPDGATTAEFGSIILRPGETYHQTTTHRFSTL
jgi:aldose 1-epimerase